MKSRIVRDFVKGSSRVLHRLVDVLKYIQQVTSLAHMLQEQRKEVKDMRYSVLAGRVLFSLLFVMAGVGHFSSQEIAFAAAQGVPLASIAVPISGLMAVIGGLSIALGYKAEWGAALIVLFLVPVTAMMHNFWSVSDPLVAQDQMAHFMKNVSLIGSALFISYFGSGPLSLDARNPRYLEDRKQRAAA